jgi:anti-anti-sigma regulatory factor
MAAAPTLFEPLSPPPPTAMSYPVGDAVVVVVDKAFLSGGFPALDRLLAQALGDGYRRLVLDLHQVSRIEPEAVGSLWGALRGIRRRGGTLAGAGARPAVAPALRALSSGGLTLHETLRAALSDAADGNPSS